MSLELRVIWQFAGWSRRKNSEAQKIRHASDYDDFYIATKSEALEQNEWTVLKIRC